jgi:hypothetical protein
MTKTTDSVNFNKNNFMYVCPHIKYAALLPIKAILQVSIQLKN